MKLDRLNHIGIATPSIPASVVASAAKQSSVSRAALGCFAALAMTGEGAVVMTGGVV